MEEEQFLIIVVNIMGYEGIIEIDEFELFAFNQHYNHFIQGCPLKNEITIQNWHLLKLTCLAANFGKMNIGM